MFTRAIVRKPGNNFADGITTTKLGNPNYELALNQHDQYCEALKKCGLKLTILESDIKYPDGCFVEDVAIITEKCAIISRLGNSARQGEEEKIKEVLSRKMKIENIKSPGTVDGGDILRIKNHFYIGLSKRTNQRGANQLKSILLNYGYTASTVPVKNILHLKTGITYIGRDNIVSIQDFSDRFKEFNVIQTDKDESYSANCLFVNDFLLIPKGFPKMRQKILDLRYKIIEVEMSEFRKMDGGLTCLSLLS